MNNFKKTWSLIIAFAFTILLSVPLSSCENPGNQNDENTEESAAGVDNPDNPKAEGEHPEGYEEGEHTQGEGKETAKHEGDHPEGDYPDN